MRASSVAAVTVVLIGSWLAYLSPPAAARSAWTIPRTAWGHPDFQGVTWNFATMTPLERPRGVDAPVFTEQEATAFERQTVERQSANSSNGYDWWDGGTQHLDRRRTSLIVDPADGRLPALTPEAERRAAAGRRARPGAEGGPEDFPLNARCIWWQNAGPPMLPSPYNDNVQFFQTRDHIVIFNENIHDARIVPMNGRPHGTIRQWMGDSRGRWDRDTLVIDTVNLSDKTSLRGSNVNLHVVERFTRVDEDTLEYPFTIEDPTVWTREWTAVLPMHRSAQPIYEFACHEGNARNMEGLLEIARFLEGKR